VIAAIEQIQEGLQAKAVSKETIARIAVTQEVNPAWFPDPMNMDLALNRAHRFRERLRLMPYRKGIIRLTSHGPVIRPLQARRFGASAATDPAA